MMYVRILVALFLYVGCVHAGSISVGFDLSSDVDFLPSKEKIQPFAQALYVLARYIIDPSTCFDMYDIDGPDAVCRDSDEKAPACIDSPQVPKKKLALSAAHASTLARHLLSRHDTKQIFQSACHVGISDDQIIAASYTLASEWDDAEAMKIFQAIQKMKQGEQNNTMRSFYYLAMGSVLSIGIFACYAYCMSDAS